MFKKQNRLPRGVGFYGSKTFPTTFFILKIKENGLTLNRFGIVVSKKIDKRAVKRNGIKRMLRKIIIDLSREMKVGYDMLFIVRPGIVNKTDDQINFATKEVLKKVGFIKQ